MSAAEGKDAVANAVFALTTDHYDFGSLPESLQTLMTVVLLNSLLEGRPIMPRELDAVVRIARVALKHA